MNESVSAAPVRSARPAQTAGIRESFVRIFRKVTTRLVSFTSAVVEMPVTSRQAWSVLGFTLLLFFLPCIVNCLALAPVALCALYFLASQLWS